MPMKEQGPDKSTDPSSKSPQRKLDEHSKDRSLDPYREDPHGQYLTTDQGLRIANTDDSLHAGERGPTLLEDFHFREKLTHFDHERIPERVVHARGSAAHGYFQVYKPLAELTRAKFLNDPAVRTPVFVRFSTVVGSRGAADTARDARGFATKFYTEEGNFDLVGNNIPVFFIQDGIKFPDLVHAVKPEPHNEMPQGASAHDTFWDFASLTPETAHMLMWVLSDRGIPRSYRMMEGFAVHTFRLINDKGRARFVKFHWKPLLGVHSLAWEEAQQLAGKDPDFHRRDLYEAIESGNFPEYELGMQIIEPEDEFSFDFDLLDSTKLVPEELVPVQRVGKMVLNRNPDNFFSETEQVAFHLGNIVPGIDFTNDPLLQARLFSYLDTQLLRLGGPNFAEIPINRPLAPVHNNQQDGLMRQRIGKSRANYSPNSIARGCPMAAPQNLGGFVSHMEKLEGHKIRQRSPSFADHFSQARLFWNSMARSEKRHIVKAAQFELGKVERKEIRQRVVNLFDHIAPELASQVAAGLGLQVPGRDRSVAPAQERWEGEGGATPSPPATDRKLTASPALSQETKNIYSVKTRRVAILAANGVEHTGLLQLKGALLAAGATAEVIALNLSPLTSEGTRVEPDQTFLTAASVLYDAVLIPGGKLSGPALAAYDDAQRFVQEAFKHCKPIGAYGDGVAVLAACNLGTAAQSALPGVITAGEDSDLATFSKEFLQALARHRFWEREEKPAEPL